MNQYDVRSHRLSAMLAGCRRYVPDPTKDVTGAGGGAALGGLIGAAAGNAGIGAAVGAGLGGTGGFLLGRHNESVNRATNKAAHQRAKTKRLSQQERNTMEQAIQLTGAGELQRSWGWFLALGIVLIVLGTIAIGSTFVMTIASVFFVGWLLIVGGVMEAVHAFWRKRWAGFFLDLLTGILYVVAGWMMVTNPRSRRYC